MTKTPDTPPPAPPAAPEPARFLLLDVGGLLAALDVAAAALDNADDQGARRVLAALDAAGYVIVKRAEP